MRNKYYRLLDVQKDQHVTADVKRLCVIRGELEQFIIDVQYLLVVEALGGLATTAVVAEEAEVHKTTEEGDGKQELEVEIGEELEILLEVEVGTEGWV